MARVRGSYVAKVIVNFDYEEDDFEFRPFEELEKDIRRKNSIHSLKTY